VPRPGSAVEPSFSGNPFSVTMCELSLVPCACLFGAWVMLTRTALLPKLARASCPDVFVLNSAESRGSEGNAVAYRDRRRFCCVP